MAWVDVDHFILQVDVKCVSAHLHAWEYTSSGVWDQGWSLYQSVLLALTDDAPLRGILSR